MIGPEKPDKSDEAVSPPNFETSVSDYRPDEINFYHSITGKFRADNNSPFLQILITDRRYIFPESNWATGRSG